MSRLISLSLQGKMKPMRQATLFLLAITLAACSSGKDQILLQQEWATLAREKMSSPQQKVTETKLSARWKVRVKGSKKLWGVAEGSLEDAQGLPAGTKVVVRLPAGTHVLSDSVELKDINLEIIGKGSDLSRLSLRAGPRGLLLKGGSLTVKNVTVSCYSTEGLTVADGNIKALGSVFNGSRHGLYLSNGQAEIRQCVFTGNEAGLDLGPAARVSIQDSIFSNNWIAITGEKPNRLSISRCLILDCVKQTFDLRFGTGMAIDRCLIVGNAFTGWSGNLAFAQITNNLLQDDAFEKYGIDQRSNDPINRLSQFPSAIAIPDKFPMPIFMMLMKRLDTLGSDKSLRTVRNFAEDEASQCINRADYYLDRNELNSAAILIQVARGFVQPYQTLKKKFAAPLKNLESSLEKKQTARAEAKKKKQNNRRTKLKARKY
jgi:hypothetical protein